MNVTATFARSVVSRSISRSGHALQRSALNGVGGTATGQQRGNHENIVEHYENPRNVGSLDKADSSVGTVCKFTFLNF